jgi:hypothetical protein
VAVEAPTIPPPPLLDTTLYNSPFRGIKGGYGSYCGFKAVFREWTTRDKDEAELDGKGTKRQRTVLASGNRAIQAKGKGKGAGAGGFAKGKGKGAAGYYGKGGACGGKKGGSLRWQDRGEHG